MSSTRQNSRINSSDPGGAISVRASLVLLLICAVASGQVMEKPLNNTDIAGMIKAGLPDGTVILAIQRAILRGNTDFDPSQRGLVELRNAGATETILNIVLAAPTIQRYEPSTTVQGLPVRHGLYSQSTAGWSALDWGILFPNVETRWETNWKVLGAWDRTRDIRRYVVPGRQASARVAGPRPVLYLRGQHPGSGWLVVRLMPQKDERELITTVPDVFASQPRMTFVSGAPVELHSVATAEDVVALQPTADLTPGSYLVFKLVPGQPWLLESYAFELGTT